MKPTIEALNNRSKNGADIFARVSRHSPSTLQHIPSHPSLDPLRRAIARAPRRAARRRRESATTLLVAEPPTALAVTAEGASRAALRVRLLRTA